jgi:hypothetical protein
MKIHIKDTTTVKQLRDILKGMNKLEDFGGITFKATQIVISKDEVTINVKVR